MKKLLTILALLLLPSIAFAQLNVPQGGTGSTTLSGILYGIPGNLRVQTATVGSGLTFTGGTLSATGGGGTPGGLNAQIQYNNLGSFGGISGATTDGTAVSLNAAHLLNPTINGAGTGLATLAYPNTASNATITFPTVTDTLATLAGTEALTNKSVNGVTLTTGGSATTYLNGAGAYSTPPGSTYTGTYPIIVTGSVISSGFGTSSTIGIGNNLFLYTNASGIIAGAASSSLNLPNTSLQNSSVTVNGSSISLGGSATVTANTTNTVTFNNSGSGDASGTTFNGGTARTISYNTIGAQVAGTYLTSVAVATANGFTGSSSGGATPTITLTTNITGVLKGNGTAISAAANGTDYTLTSAQTCSAGSFVSALTASGGSTCTASSGGSAFPFTPTNNFGVNTNATSTTLSLFAGVNASSTSHIASTTFDVSGFVGIGTTTNNVQGSSFAAVITNSVASLGGLLIQTWTNITNAFTIKNAAGATVFNVDTTATGPFLGVGTTTPWATLSAVGSGTNPVFAVSTSTSGNALPNFEVDSFGHVLTSGPQPVCTTNCTFIAGNDSAFRIVTGTAVTSITVTFAHTWGTLAPICSASEGGAASQLISASSTPTTLVITTGTITTKDLEIICQGIQ